MMLGLPCCLPEGTPGQTIRRIKMTATIISDGAKEMVTTTASSNRAGPQALITLSDAEPHRRKRSNGLDRIYGSRKDVDFAYLGHYATIIC